MKKVSYTDFCEIKSLPGITASPDGKKAAFVVRQPDLEKDRYLSHIWVWEDGKLCRLTGMGKESGFIWLDDEQILFPGDRQEKYKGKPPHTVYNRISIRGGEAEEAFVLPFAASGPVSLGDGKFLVRGVYDPMRFTSEDGSLREKTADELEADKRVEIFDELPFWQNGQGVINKKRSRVYLCDTLSGTQTALTPELMDVSSFEYSKEKGELIIIGEEYTDMAIRKQSVRLYTLDGSYTELLPRKDYGVSDVWFFGEDFLMMASDGKKYGTSQNDSFFLLKRDGSLEKLCDPDMTIGGGAGSDCAAGGRSIVMEDESLYCLETRDYISFIVKMDPRTGERVQLTPADCGRVDGFDKKGDVIYYTAMKGSGLQELYRLENGTETKLTSFNDEYLETHDIIPPEYIPFTDKEGVRIDGWIIRPADYDPEKTYPAILDVHGGPKGVYGTVYFHEMQLWANMGYFVFFCNPHGGSGRGDEFSDIFGEQYGVRDYNDLMEFTDHVLALYPQIDKEKVGMTGGSYGGFMANWIVGHTDRFAAVASQRSISNYISKCLTTDIGYYHNLSALEASPWENFDQLWEHSPLKHAC
ncbi:MAG: S9 family peptidase, partial [Oscillospiraceae bacterium]|nr:S9 family peptidase [Oscillospiraceae bacterium]